MPGLDIHQECGVEWLRRAVQRHWEPEGTRRAGRSLFCGKDYQVLPDNPRGHAASEAEPDVV